MSIETWKKEFYPVGAKVVRKDTDKAKTKAETDACKHTGWMNTCDSCLRQKD